MSDRNASIKMLMLPDEIFGIIFDFRPTGSLSVICQRIRNAVHLRRVSIQNLPPLERIDAMARHGTKHLRMLITQDVEVWRLKSFLEAVQSLETVSLTIYSPSITLVEYLATFKERLVGLTIIFCTHREVAERLGVLSDVIMRLSNTLKQCEIRFTNCPAEVPRSAFIDEVDGIPLDLYRNRSSSEWMRIFMIENLKHGLRTAFLQQLLIDFSADPDANLPPWLLRQRQPPHPQNQISPPIYNWARQISNATGLHNFVLVVEDHQTNSETIKTTVSLNNNPSTEDDWMNQLLDHIVVICKGIQSNELRLQNVKLSVGLYQKALAPSFSWERSSMTNIQLEQQAPVQELNLDFSAEDCQDPNHRLALLSFYLVTNIKQPTSLRKLALTLNDSRLDLELVCSIMKAFNNTTALTNLQSLTLRLNNNPAIGDAGVAAIVSDLVTTSYAVQELELELQNVGLTDAGASHLCLLAQSLTSLHHLDLLVAYNALSDEAIHALRRSAGRNLTHFSTNAAWQNIGY